MNEHDFNSKLAGYLKHGESNVGGMAEIKLRSARLRALEAYREPVRLFGLVTIPGPAATLKYSFIQRPLLLLPVAILIGILAAANLRQADVGEIDAQLLTGELPIEAFLDKDFSSWLDDASR
jgi:hypothetical protein